MANWDGLGAMLSHRRFRRAPAFLLLLTAIASASPAHADTDPFTLTLTPYAWLPAVDGTIGAKGLTTDVNASFIDIWDDTDTHLGFFGRLEARANRLGFFVDGGYMKLGADNVSTQRGFGNADITTELGIIDFGLLFRLLDLPTPFGPDDSRFSLDLTASAQYWTLGLEVAPDRFPSRSGGKAWIDPMLGARATLTLGQHLQLLAGGEVGGFDAASQFSWSAIATVGYLFNIGSVQSSVFLGYKAIGDDFTSGSGRNQFTWDTTLHGPVIGMSFTF